jgi:predicted Zn-dependent protease
LRPVERGTGAARLATMTPPDTFIEMARRLAREGAGAACDLEADRLMARARQLPTPRARTLRRAAIGLTIAARALYRLSPGGPRPGFRPIGLRGAIAAGSLALARGRTRQAELIGLAAAAAAPDSPAGLRLAGQALFAQERFGAAVSALAAAIARDPFDAFTRALHAEALVFSGEHDAGWRALSLARGRGGEPSALAHALDQAIRSGALRRAGRRGMS